VKERKRTTSWEEKGSLPSFRTQKALLIFSNTCSLRFPSPFAFSLVFPLRAFSPDARSHGREARPRGARSGSLLRETRCCSSLLG